MISYFKSVSVSSSTSKENSAIFSPKTAKSISLFFLKSSLAREPKSITFVISLFWAKSIICFKTMSFKPNEFYIIKHPF